LSPEIAFAYDFNPATSAAVSSSAAPFLGEFQETSSGLEANLELGGRLSKKGNQF